MFCHSMTLNLSNILRCCFKSKCWHLDFKCSIDFLGFICLIYFITAVDWPWLIAQLLQPTSQLEFPGSWVENSCLSLARQVWHGENLVYYQFKRELDVEKWRRNNTVSLPSQATQRQWGLQPVCNSSFQLLSPQTVSSAASWTLFMGCSPFLLQWANCQAAAFFRTYVPSPGWDSPWSVVWISAPLWSLLEHLEHLLLLL